MICLGNLSPVLLPWSNIDHEANNPKSVGILAGGGLYERQVHRDRARGRAAGPGRRDRALLCGPAGDCVTLKHDGRFILPSCFCSIQKRLM